MPRPDSKKSRKALTAREREEKCLQFRMAGWKYARMAEELGCSEEAARQAVQRALDRTNERIKAEAPQVLALELERLDRLTAAVWKKALAGDYAAIDRVMKLQQQRARYVPGLMAPTALEVTGKDGAPLINTSDAVVLLGRFDAIDKAAAAREQLEAALSSSTTPVEVEDVAEAAE